MKTVTLFRHAKSSWKHDTLDMYRPLNARGYRDAPRMAAQFAAHAPERILCSPAVRAYSTALFYLGQMQLPLSVLQLDWALYESSGQQLLSLLKAQPEGAQVLWLFGHNPGLNQLLSLCLGKEQENLVTGAWVCLRFDCRHWQDIETAHTSLLDSAKPDKSKENPC